MPAADGEPAERELALTATAGAAVPAPAIATGGRSSAGWRVQLGAFRNGTRAAKATTALAQTLADLPWAGVLVIDYSKGDGLFRVVLADSFAHRGEATAKCAAVSARGAQCFVAPAPPRPRAAPDAADPKGLLAALPPSKEEAVGHEPVPTLVAVQRATAPAPLSHLVLKRLDALEAENRSLRASCKIP